MPHEYFETHLNSSMEMLTLISSIKKQPFQVKFIREGFKKNWTISRRVVYGLKYDIVYNHTDQRNTNHRELPEGKLNVLSLKTYSYPEEYTINLSLLR